MKKLRIYWQSRKLTEKVTLALTGFYLLGVLLLALVAPALPFAPNQLDLENPYLEPAFISGISEHWLGTDSLGRDVLANVIFGFRTGFAVALPVMLVSVLLGGFLGNLAGFYGNRGLRISRSATVAAILFGLLAFFYGVYIFRFQWQEVLTGGRQSLAEVFLKSAGAMSGTFVFCWLLHKLLKTLGFFRKKVKLPLDELVLKTTELLSIVPRLILVLCFAAVITPGFGSLILLLCLTFWTGPARLARTEALRLKELAFVEAARVSGLPDRRIIFGHILPNAAGALITAFCFGLGGLLGLESGLSFVGIGLPPETPGWGRLLAGVRLNPEAWWLLLFPAVALWFTVLAIQTFGNFLQKALQNR